MAKMSANYEVVYIIDPAQGEEAIAATVAKFQALAEQNGSDVVAWRQTAEFVARYFTKGRMAVVEGRLQIRDWQDRDGNKRRSAEVVADNVYFGDSKRDGAPAGDYAPASGGRGSYGGAPQYGAPSGGYTAPVASSSGDFAEIDEEDGDLPF